MTADSESDEYRKFALDKDADLKLGIYNPKKVKSGKHNSPQVLEEAAKLADAPISEDAQNAFDQAKAKAAQARRRRLPWQR